jgi:uncharacterized protein YdeI (YjbR/CyaY-like superfamily)
MPKSDLPMYHAKGRQEWRRWLEQNHATSSGVWLVYYKKGSGKSRLAHDEAVEEALCFGWIDGLLNKLDHERYKVLFSPRKPQSTWSKINKERVERLIAHGLMTPAGMAKVEIARENGSWNVLDEVEALTIPDDLALAFAANPTAERNFMAFSKSVKKGILNWLRSARRITDTVGRAERNIRINFDNE